MISYLHKLLNEIDEDTFMIPCNYEWKLINIGVWAFLLGAICIACMSGAQDAEWSANLYLGALVMWFLAFILLACGLLRISITQISASVTLWCRPDMRPLGGRVWIRYPTAEVIATYVFLLLLRAFLPAFGNHGLMILGGAENPGILEFTGYLQFLFPTVSLLMGISLVTLTLLYITALYHMPSKPAA